MKLIKNKIKSLEQKLENYKMQLTQSYDSIKEYWNSVYHNSFDDKCKMVYLLAQGLEYKPYSFSDRYKIEHAKEWNNNNNYFDYCHIYDEGYGNPIGFISLNSGLFDATSGKHKKMWLRAIEDKKEERSFEEFKKQLQKDPDFLKKSFENLVKETGTGVYSTNSYLIEFEEKRLKTGKYYIYLEGTSRRL